MFLHGFKKASSAKGNWSKSEAFWCGDEALTPQLSGNLKWTTTGYKFLGFLEMIFKLIEKLKKKKGLVNEMCERLSKWMVATSVVI